MNGQALIVQRAATYTRRNKTRWLLDRGGWRVVEKEVRGVAQDGFLDADDGLPSTCPGVSMLKDCVCTPSSPSHVGTHVLAA
jgi:hypothetical protein